MAADLSSHEQLSGPQRAAVVLLALDSDRVSMLFGMMSLDEIKELSAHMSQLGQVPSELIEQVLVDFVDRLSSTGTLHGSIDTTERLLRASLDPERAEEVLEEMRGPAGRTMWDKLNNVHHNLLANYLKNEYPQTVAVVLSKLFPDHAARVLSELPEDFATEVMMRMLQMENVQPEILNNVEYILRTEFMSNLSATSRRDPHEQMAEIFNSFDRASEARFMQLVEERDREASDRIRGLMFTFDDLNRLDPTGVQVLLREADKDRLAIALKAASDEVRNLFFSNMSERAAKIMREDMEAMGPVRMSDVEEAQTEIVNQAKDLEAKGEIILGGGDEESFVY